jgi:hypothetical protein
VDIIVFWDMMPCGQVEIYWCFEVTCCSHLQDRKFERGESTDIGSGSVRIWAINVNRVKGTAKKAVALERAVLLE